MGLYLIYKIKKEGKKMKKRVIKKIRLKERVKTILVIGLLQLATFGLLTVYLNRTEAIQNNQNGYTESGHAHSVNVQIIR